MQKYELKEQYNTEGQYKGSWMMARDLDTPALGLCWKVGFFNETCHIEPIAGIPIHISKGEADLVVLGIVEWLKKNHSDILQGKPIVKGLQSFLRHSREEQDISEDQLAELCGFRIERIDIDANRFRRTSFWKIERIFSMLGYKLVAVPKNREVKEGV